MSYPFNNSPTLAPILSPEVSATNISFPGDATGNVNFSQLEVTVPNGSNSAATAVTNNSSFAFTVTPNFNFLVNLQSLNFTATVNEPSSSNGYVVRSSIDNFSENLATGFFTLLTNNVSVDLTSFPGINFTSPLTFQVYSYRGSGTNPVVAYDNLVLNGTATEVPFESDSLPVVGATLFMAGGLWWKRKRNQDKIAQLIEKQ